MEFGIPTRVGDNYPKHRDPLKAEGNLSYLEFLEVLKHLWSEAHPDIPVRASQSKAFEKYPVIIYSLQLRKPLNVEPKIRHRESITRDDEDTNVVIQAQRFQNVITFEVRTKGQPEMAEIIIEVFEDFMEEHTPIFKRLGVSDIFYMRRTPDDEDTRKDVDVDVRGVAYMVTLEKIKVTEEQKLKELTVRARTFIKNQGTGFYVEENDSTFITVVNQHFNDGDYVRIMKPNQEMIESYPEIPPRIPHQLTFNSIYRISRPIGAQENTVYLTRLDGKAITLISAGLGRLVQVSVPYGNIEIEDNFQTATPNYDD